MVYESGYSELICWSRRLFYLCCTNFEKHFIVDNAETMEPHWASARFLLKTLVLKATGQDDNGLDLGFTCTQNRLVNQKSSSNKWDKIMISERPSQGAHTNMNILLGEIFTGYLESVREASQQQQAKNHRNLTLIILTDGLWTGMGGNHSALNDLIVNFVKQVTSYLGEFKSRPVSFQFIQFGSDADASYRLRQLDSGMKWKGIP